MKKFLFMLACSLAGPTASEGVNEFVGSLAQQAGQTRDQVEKEWSEGDERHVR